MNMNVKEIEAHELADWIDQQDGVRVIDVRQPHEIAAGTIPGAETMPLATVPVRMHELDRDQTLVFICRSGARSYQACAYLAQQGYQSVINLRGGIISWASKGLPAALPQTA